MVYDETGIDAKGEAVRSARARESAGGRADAGGLDAMGNATHLSIAGDLFEGCLEKDLRLDAARALTSLEPIAGADGGRRDAIVSKDGLRRMRARLDRASGKFSTDMQGFERRSALSTPVRTQFVGLCALEYSLLRVFSTLCALMGRGGGAGVHGVSA